MKTTLMAGTLFAALTHAALANETIGTISATLDGAEVQWQTIQFTNSDGTDASASVQRIGPISMIAIQGSGDEGTLVIEAAVTGSPGTDAAVEVMGITLFPKGEGFMGMRWTSEEVGTPPDLTFTTLEVGDTEGRAEGAFDARLCRAEGFEDVDVTTCKQMSGSFETRLLVVAE